MHPKALNFFFSLPLLLCEQKKHRYLLAFPAVLASLLFVARVVWLKRHSREHHLGRTGWIFWPTTLAMLVGASALIARLVLEEDDLSQLELIATGSMAIAWVTALLLKA